MPDSLSILEAPLTLRDYWEILRIPALFAAIAIAGTWAVWYLTSMSCTADLAQATGCNPSAIARYVNLDALNKMLTHAVIGGGGGGLWSFAMITRERRAREAERQAREAERQAREAAERQLVEERQRSHEQRQRSEEERARADEQQRLAEEERQRLLAIIEGLTPNHNGSSPPDGHSPEPTQ